MTGFPVGDGAANLQCPFMIRFKLAADAPNPIGVLLLVRLISGVLGCSTSLSHEGTEVILLIIIIIIQSAVDSFSHPVDSYRP